jgi:hypothetical protein
VYYTRASPSTRDGVFRRGKKSSARNCRDVCTVPCTVFWSSDALEYNSSENYINSTHIATPSNSFLYWRKYHEASQKLASPSSMSNSPRVWNPGDPCLLLPLTGPASYPLQQRSVSCVCKAGVMNANSFECAPSIIAIHKYITMQRSGILSKGFACLPSFHHLHSFSCAVHSLAGLSSTRSIIHSLILLSCFISYVCKLFIPYNTVNTNSLNRITHDALQLFLNYAACGGYCQR